MTLSKRQKNKLEELFSQYEAGDLNKKQFEAELDELSKDSSKTFTTQIQRKLQYRKELAGRFDYVIDAAELEKYKETNNNSQGNKNNIIIDNDFINYLLSLPKKKELNRYEDLILLQFLTGRRFKELLTGKWKFLRGKIEFTPAKKRQDERAQFRPIIELLPMNKIKKLYEQVNSKYEGDYRNINKSVNNFLKNYGKYSSHNLRGIYANLIVDKYNTFGDLSRGSIFKRLLNHANSGSILNYDRYTIQYDDPVKEEENEKSQNKTRKFCEDCKEHNNNMSRHNKTKKHIAAAAANSVSE